LSHDCPVLFALFGYFNAIGPIIDPHEFRERFIASYHAKLAASASASSSLLRQHPKSQYKATDDLSLLANVLTTWAASYGVDEYGHEDADANAQDLAAANASNRGIGTGGNGAGNMGGDGEGSEQAVANAAARKKARRMRVTEMVKEILEGVDRLALLRRPTWDGVRVLMLLMPLTEGKIPAFFPPSWRPLRFHLPAFASLCDRGRGAWTQGQDVIFFLFFLYCNRSPPCSRWSADSLGPMDRLSMYQSTISQIYTLCTHGSSLVAGSFREKLVIARTFWYAYVHEGMICSSRTLSRIFAAFGVLPFVILLLTWCAILFISFFLVGLRGK